jgi:hypothetical protein
MNLLADPKTFMGMRVVIRDAQQQARTARDVPGTRVRLKMPTKKAGRRGTRRAWKRSHPPHWLYYYREPTDVLVLRDASLVIVTPRQYDIVRRAIIASEVP